MSTRTSDVVFVSFWKRPSLGTYRLTDELLQQSELPYVGPRQIGKVKQALKTGAHALTGSSRLSGVFCKLCISSSHTPDAGSVTVAHPSF